MKKIIKTMANICSFVAFFCTFAGSCAKTPQEPSDSQQNQQKKQSLTISDVEVRAGEAAVALNIEFGIPDSPETIVYSYNEAIISIIDNRVTGLTEGRTTVTATAETCSATFEVTVLSAEDEGDLLTFANAVAWVGHPATELDYSVAQSVKNEEISYSYDATKISIANGAVTALAEGTVEVTATVKNFSVNFTVNCKTVDKSTWRYAIGSSWQEKADSLREQWELFGNDNATTLFIGDSFFDCPTYWSDFYSKYYGSYDARCFGIGGTTSCTWEVLADSLLSGVQAKNVVVNLGNNNIYNDKTDAQTTIEDLERFYTLLHGRMPNAKVYIFSVTQRNIPDTEEYDPNVKIVNSAIEDWCKNRSWATYLDLQNKLTADKLSDRVHPKTEYYSYFTEALTEAGISIEKK